MRAEGEGGHAAGRIGGLVCVGVARSRKRGDDGAGPPSLGCVGPQNLLQGLAKAQNRLRKDRGGEDRPRPAGPSARDGRPAVVLPGAPSPRLAPGSRGSAGSCPRRRARRLGSSQGRSGRSARARQSPATPNPSLREAKRRSNPCRRLPPAEKIAPSSARNEGRRDDQRARQRPCGPGSLPPGLFDPGVARDDGAVRCRLGSYNRPQNRLQVPEKAKNRPGRSSRDGVAVHEPQQQPSGPWVASLRSR
ncbi:hypothetical protein DFR50_109123 [Roseiarcus fermentans]|uniref:Uncharacterized protein n=1 Tax=Roseiarcus fermentans TaxID=1473586 RepID=A0A366FK72_9HYPH|nr:hypothetical protein DFR50_109123 [Roseiarcus fermentans]